jgi:hypothetical protein
LSPGVLIGIHPYILARGQQAIGVRTGKHRHSRTPRAFIAPAEAFDIAGVWKGKRQSKGAMAVSKSLGDVEL